VNTESTYLSKAEQLDREDPLSSYREQFTPPDPGLIYLDGNSLGRLPVRTAESLHEVVTEQWGNSLIRGWGEGWMDLPRRLGDKIALLIGAEPGEVLVCDGTSINLYKLVMAAMEHQEGRRRILSDELNFPSDLHVLQGIVHQLGPGYELDLIRSRDGMCIDFDSVRDATDKKTALLTFTHTYYKSSFVQDMAGITALAHEKGAMVLWDLSHSVGSVPVDLKTCRADLAIGCTYKYLNGGPGSTAFLYVRRDLQKKLQQPIWGWLGSKDPFQFGTLYEPAENIRRFLVGTPPILSMSAIEPALDLHLEAGIYALREKSLRQSEFLIEMFENWPAGLGFTLGSPRSAGRRGSHVVLRHPEAAAITEALIGPPEDRVIVIPDFRAPDNIRLGIAPLYNSYKDIYTGMQRIREVVESKEYLKNR
jgi:kynureninase